MCTYRVKVCIFSIIKRGIQAHSNTSKQSDGSPRFADSKAYSCFVKTAEYDPDNPPATLPIHTEVQVRNHSEEWMVQQGKTPALEDTDPVVKITSDRGIVTSPRLWFCLNFKVKQNMEFLDWNVKELKRISFNQDTQITHRVKFRIGDLYYNGETWTTSESTFLINLEVVKKGESYTNTYKSVKNTNEFTLGLGDITGYVFKAPNVVTAGTCELTIYAKTHHASYSPGHGVLFDRCFPYTYIKDINLSYTIKDDDYEYGEWLSKEGKTDCIYENVIDEGYVEKADEIDLKICTNTDGKLAYSSVLEGDVFLEKIRTDVFGTGVPEEILLQRVISLFSKPRYVIDPVLANDTKPYTKFTEPHLNKQFLVAGGDEDVKMERMRFNLIEIL